MLRMDEIIDYGPCYVLAVHCPADGVSLPRKKVLYDVCDGATHESVYTFNTARQAKKFARHYVSDPEGAVQQKRQLSADRITHVRALWAISLLLVEPYISVERSRTRTETSRKSKPPRPKRAIEILDLSNQPPNI